MISTRRFSRLFLPRCRWSDGKMRERRVAENREHFQSISGNMRDFSEMQMATYLKSTQLKRKMETVIKGTGGGVAQLEGESGGGEASENRLAISGGGGGAGVSFEGNESLVRTIAGSSSRNPWLLLAGAVTASTPPPMDRARSWILCSVRGRSPSTRRVFTVGAGDGAAAGAVSFAVAVAGVATVSLAQAHPSERRRSVSSSPP